MKMSRRDDPLFEFTMQKTFKKLYGDSFRKERTSVRWHFPEIKCELRPYQEEGYRLARIHAR